MTDITNRPFNARDFMLSITEFAWKASSPLVGSSRNRTAGSIQEKKCQVIIVN